MPFMLMEHEVDPKEKLLKDLGDLSEVEIFNNQLLVAVYLRPEKTKSGFYLPDQNRAEDQFQSKVGLLVKTLSVRSYTFVTVLLRLRIVVTRLGLQVLPVVLLLATSMQWKSTSYLSVQFVHLVRTTSSCSVTVHNQ